MGRQLVRGKPFGPVQALSAFLLLAYPRRAGSKTAHTVFFSPQQPPCWARHLNEPKFAQPILDALLLLSIELRTRNT